MMGFELTALRICWIALAVAGAVASLLGLGVQPASSSAGIALATLGLWCLTETMVRRNWLALLTLPAMGLGIGCALPLYLFLRSRRID